MFRIELSPEIWLSMKSWRDLGLGVRVRLECLVERGEVRVGLPTLHLHERIEVLRVGVVRIPRGGGDRDRPERRAARWRVEDALDLEPLGDAVDEGDVDRRAHLEVVALRVVLIDEGTALAQVRQRFLRTVHPVERNHLARPGIDRRREDRLVEDEGIARANAADRRHTGRRCRGLGRRDRNRIEVVLCCDRIVAGEDVVHGARERLNDAGRERCDEGDEREADHQCGRGRGGALRVAPAVLAAELRALALGQEARELHGPFGLPAEERLPNPHERNDPGDRIQDRDDEDDQRKDARDAPARGEGGVTVEPVEAPDREPDRQRHDHQDQHRPARNRREHLRERRYEPGRDAGDTGEEQQDADAEPEQHLRGAEPVHEEPVQERKRPESDRDDRPNDARPEQRVAEQHQHEPDHRQQDREERRPRARDDPDGGNRDPDAGYDNRLWRAPEWVERIGR